MDNDIVKKVVYNRLDTKVNASDTKLPSNNWLVTKTLHDSDKQNLEKKKFKMLIWRYLIVAD